VGASHGVLAVWLSRSLASVADGLQFSGGFTTMDRSVSGASAAIIAVSARNRWVTVNCVLSGSTPELVSPVASTPVSTWSASRMVMFTPEAVRIEVTASSGSKPAELAGGISLLFSTAAPMCWAVARLVSTLRSAVPPAGTAIVGPNDPCSTLSATA
jgi:hypothetical protein